MKAFKTKHVANLQRDMFWGDEYYNAIDPMDMWLMLKTDNGEWHGKFRETFDIYRWRTVLRDLR